MPESTATIALIYPTLLGTYGDGGNATVLAQRLRWRGYRARVLSIGLGDAMPTEADFYVLGGGEDSAQVLAVQRLGTGGVLPRLVAASRPIFAVCAGYQILGHTFLDGAGRTHRGLGLLDCHTYRPAAERAVGELSARPLLPGPNPFPVLTGFENHGGRTRLGSEARPLAVVTSGIGNGDGTDGALQGSIVATYAHGPALARNPALADYLLSMVLGPLQPLDDSEEAALRWERLSALSAPHWRRLLRYPADSVAAARGGKRRAASPSTAAAPAA